MICLPLDKDFYPAELVGRSGDIWLRESGKIVGNIEPADNEWVT